MGNGASGKLVTEVKRNIADRITTEELFIIDGSPGIGCPVIASITGAHLVLAVAEPSQSGLNDLERVVGTAKGFGARCLVCINKYDINPKISEQILDYCAREEVIPVGRIPFDPLVSEAINSGKTIVDYPESKAGRAIVELWERIEKIILERSF
jgi:MinD superfamily P-loop ATPase